MNIISAVSSYYSYYFPTHNPSSTLEHVAAMRLDDWLALPVNNHVEKVMVGDLPGCQINWRDPAILTFGNYDKAYGLRDVDKWRLERHGMHEKASYLSNYYPVEIEVDGRRYKSIEHYYQAVKFPIDGPIYSRVVGASSGDEARLVACGYKDEASLGEDQEMGSRMKRGLWAKFINPNNTPTDLGERLLATGDQPLYEGNQRGGNPNKSDRRWGVEFDFSEMPQRLTMIGSNILGKLLMEIRASLKSSVSK